MRISMARITTRVALLVALSLVGAGCSKKATETPPTPPPAPPQTTDTQPAPTPQETPTPPTPVLSASDFQPAFFDYDSYALREDARSALDHNAKLLRDNPESRVTVEGHCDERGTVEYNQALGERRAQAAHAYLVGAGIQESRLSVISYGKERPFDSGHDEAAWAKNRRAHFVLQ